MTRSWRSGDFAANKVGLCDHCVFRSFLNVQHVSMVFTWFSVSLLFCIGCLCGFCMFCLLSLGCFDEQNA